MRSNNRTIAYICLLITFFCWGSVYVANRYILSALTPMELACCRFLVSAAALGSYIRIRGVKIEVPADCRKPLFLIGFLGYFLSMECTLLSVDYLSASLASLINSLNPVFITLFAVIYLKEKMTLTKVICLVTALAGVFIVSGGSTGGGQLLGVIYGIGSILFWARSAVFSRKISGSMNPLVITFLGISISLIFHIPVAAFSLLSSGIPEIRPIILLCILYSGLFGTAIPQFTWNKALSHLEASSCSMFYPLMPVFSAILGVLLLHETLGPSFFLGGTLILATVVISCLGNRSVPGK